MPSSSAQECPICLEKLLNPVVTPCGHLSCQSCMKSYVRASQDPYEANCPTCRTSFPIVVPDLSMIPKKYHVFIAPSIRRVYLQDGPSDASELVANLNTEVLALQRRVTSLTRDKHLLMDRAEAAQSALDRLSFEERAARLEAREANEKARQANQKYQLLLDKHHALQARVPAAVVPAPAKRTGEQAALDASTRSDSPSSDSSSSPAEFLFRGKRIYRPMPKRPRLQPMVAQTPRPSTLATSSRVAVSSPSSSSSSSSSPATSRITSNSVIEQSDSDSQSDSEATVRASSERRTSRSPAPPAATFVRVLRPRPTRLTSRRDDLEQRNRLAEQGFF